MSRLTQLIQTAQETRATEDINQALKYAALYFEMRYLDLDIFELIVKKLNALRTEDNVL